MEKYHTAG